MRVTFHMVVEMLPVEVMTVEGREARHGTGYQSCMQMIDWLSLLMVILLQKQVNHLIELAAAEEARSMISLLFGTKQTDPRTDDVGLRLGMDKVLPRAGTILGLM